LTTTNYTPGDRGQKGAKKGVTYHFNGHLGRIFDSLGLMSTILIWGLIEPFQASIKGAPHPVVNFINILCVHFLYESELSSFILIIDEIDT